MSQSPVLISIDGNIGSGKSTLLRKLRERHPDWQFIDEPVESWMALKDDSGVSLLELFYQDKHRWAYTFQNTALLTRILNAREAIRSWETAGRPGKPIFITERCVHTDANVFAKIMRREGDINRLEWDLYKKWYDAFAGVIPSPAGYIHIDTDPDVCLQRIGQRARDGEGGIPLEYLRLLGGAHTEWLQASEFTMPVMRVDNVSSEPTPLETVERWIEARWLETVD